MTGTSWRHAFSGLIPLVVATSFLLAVVGITAVFIAEQERTASGLLKAINANNQLPRVLAALQDAETGQRGFLLTGREGYLEPFVSATTTISTLLGRLEALYDDRPGNRMKLAQLRRTVEAKIAEMQKTVDLRRRGDSASALEIVNTDTGFRLMADVRALLDGLEEDSYRVVVERQNEAKTIGRRVELAISASILIAGALAAFVLATARARERRLATTLGKLQTAHAELITASENRERLETQLRQAQKMKSLGHLTGGLAHDFNNLLAVIMGNLHLMKRRPQGDISRYIDNALQGAERGATLIHRLLAFARQQPLMPEALQLNKLVPSLSEMLRRTLGGSVQIEVILAGGLWSTMVDGNQLEIAIVNLAVNGRDAMPDGGRLTIETANTHLDEAYAADNHGVTPGQYVLIAVSDSGTGMAPEVIAQAFDPFFTTKDVGKGTGLGLSQVYGFVKQSKGHIKIYSELGKGTTVKIYVPRYIKTEPEAQGGRTVSAQRDAEIPLGHPTKAILVVEDEDRVRRTTVDCLRELQYTVIHADGGESALRILETHPDISLLFTDVVMPGMTGKQLADAVKVKRPDIKVLFTTGYTRNAIVHNGVVDSGVQLLGKPFTLPQLARRIRDVIGS